MKSPSLSPHSIIQPSAPQNMQELASHLVCTACVIHLAPHSLHHTPQAIYAHTQTTGFTIRALHTHICNPCPLRPCHLRRSPCPSLHPPRTPAFAPQSMLAPLAPIPLHHLHSHPHHSHLQHLHHPHAHHLHPHGVRFAYGISPKACAQRSLCRRFIAQSFEATAKLGL